MQSNTAPSARQREAAERVQNSEALSEWVFTLILGTYRDPEKHFEWVATAPEEEIIQRCRTHADEMLLGYPTLL